MKKIGELQNVLYASHTRSLLVVIQGMDASGKDGAIRNVFAGINPMGILVISFKKPTEEELDYDFLWRIHKNVPPIGMIHVFNRSQDVFEKCNVVPWDIIPADHNFYKEYLIAKKVLKTLEDMNLSYPPPKF